MRHAFAAVGGVLIDVVSTIEPHEFDIVATDQWNVRELLAHTLRSFSLIGSYLDGPFIDGSCATAGEYFRRALADSATHNQIAERGRQSAVQLTDPLTQTRVAVEDGLTRSADAADNLIMSSFMGQIPFGEYLRTRLVEATLHSLDLIDALGRSVELPPLALRLTVDALIDAASSETLTTIARAVSGRGALAPGFNILG